MTINAAHKYLGLTTEVIRAEDAINKIACHPLPPSFYEGGGLQQLRQRFDRQTGTESPPDYFNRSTDSINHISDDAVFTDSPVLTSQTLSGSSRETPVFNRTQSSRHAVQAGDLHTSVGLNDPHKSFHRGFSTVNVNRPGRGTLLGLSHLDEGHHIPLDEFDLKEEVMSCIAKSIGLHQPPLSEPETRDASPSFPAAGSPNGSRSPNAFTSFGSLTLLETADDASSATGESTAVSSQGLGILDNEVEILYFTAGSTLARVGEQHPGETSLHSMWLIAGSYTTLRPLLCHRWYP